MGANIVIVCLILTLYTHSSNPVIIANATTQKNQDPVPTKPPHSYQVTENVIDIPDDRTLPPIISNYTISKPINVANTNVTINKNNKNDTGDENVQLKKSSFTYVHITKESENEGPIKKFFRGIKDYVYSLKRGVVDGLHGFFHKDDKDDKKKDKEEGFYDRFHRSDADVNNDEEADFHQKFHRNYDSKDSYNEYNFEDFKHEFEEY